MEPAGAQFAENDNDLFEFGGRIVPFGALRILLGSQQNSGTRFGAHLASQNTRFGAEKIYFGASWRSICRKAPRPSRRTPKPTPRIPPGAPPRTPDPPEPGLREDPTWLLIGSKLGPMASNLTRLTHPGDTSTVNTFLNSHFANTHVEKSLCNSHFVNTTAANPQFFIFQ